MKVLISTSAAPFAAGQRIAAEFDKNDWAVGTIVKQTPTGYRIDFDYGEQKLLKTTDAKIVAVDKKTKIKKSLTLAEVNALKPAKVAKTPATETKAVPTIKGTPDQVKKIAANRTKTAEIDKELADLTKKFVSGKCSAAEIKRYTTLVKQSQKLTTVSPVNAINKPAPKPAPAPKQEKAVPKTFVGSVVKSRFGNIVVLQSKIGRKYVEYEWAKIDNLSSTGWLKSRIGDTNELLFARYPFVRRATDSEMHGGHAGIRALVEKKEAVKTDAYQKIKQDQIQPGDVVRVAYSNTLKNEAVLEIDYRSMQVAIVRQQSGAASSYTKRRMIPVKLCTKVADGGGKFDPNNPIYAANHVFIPQFYKDGNTVAKRSSIKSRYGDFGGLFR